MGVPWFEDPGLDYWDAMPMSELKVDEAYLNITLATDVPRPIYLYQLSDDCERCPFVRKASNYVSTVLKVNTKSSSIFRLYTEDDDVDYKPVNRTRGLYCEVTPDPPLGEFGCYNLYVQGGKCELRTAREPVNIVAPLVFWVAVLLVLFSIVKTSKYYILKRKEKAEEEGEGGGEEPAPVEEESPSPPRRKRVKSLDAFRGIAITIMIFVNFGAGQYQFLDHAAWNGLNLADLVFPWFLWIMGVTIPIVMSSNLRKNVSRHQIFLQIIKRSAILFVFNLMLNTFTYNGNLATIRINGVLQRFATTYLVVAGFAAYFTFQSDSGENSLLPSFVKDITLLLPQWFIHSTILCLHGWVTFHLQMPGCPRGYTGPGGYQDDARYYNCTGGAANYIDLLLVGPQRLWDRGPAREVYHAVSYDPEPLLGTLSSIYQVFLGTVAGNVLLHHKDTESRIKRWLLYASLCFLLTFYLVGVANIPVNKQLWSSSFMFLTSGISFVLLSILYIAIDHFNVWDGSPFFYAGMNPTLLYVGHNIAVMFPFIWHISPNNTHFQSMGQNLWTVLLWILIAKWLHYKRYFYSV
uniref:Heparan-alpha-glucosaminide N-acetyltransferase n=2 Tax=Cacopsylla melanoneura TaxID=428564 RepID=A0A8D8SUS2_9HEMI